MQFAALITVVAELACRRSPLFTATASKGETDCRGESVQLDGGSDGHQICPNALYIDETLQIYRKISSHWTTLLKVFQACLLE